MAKKIIKKIVKKLKLKAKAPGKPPVVKAVVVKPVAKVVAKPVAKAAAKPVTKPVKPDAPERFSPAAQVPVDTFHEHTPVKVGKKTGPLPGNFPGRQALISAGFPTYEAVRNIADLGQIAGIDAETAKLIEAALKE